MANTTEQSDWLILLNNATKYLATEVEGTPLRRPRCLGG